MPKHPYPHPHLQPRQIEILQLAAEGKTDKEIALDLRVSPSTVKCQLNTIYRELFAKNRAHAVALGIHHNIIAPKIVV